MFEFEAFCDEPGTGAVEVEQNLQADSNTVLSAQHSALAKAEEVHSYLEDMDDAKEQLKEVHFSASKARDNAKMAKMEASKFDVDYVAEAGCRRDEVGKLKKQLRQ